MVKTKQQVKLTATLDLTAPKKHSIRYDGEDIEAALTSAYVTKAALENAGFDIANPPQQILVEITPL